ncbi:efflux RND transporter permease subunit [Patescibacteria group bacterium]|nr:efflux RND transporter permease subunit [Patescibacteria group bacterium]
MQNFWIFFTRKKSFTILLILALIVTGLFSLVSIPKESAPEIQIPVAIISTFLPGASAVDTERLITNKIEDQLINNLDSLDSITSTSGEGFSSVVVQFNADADIQLSIQKVKDEIDKVKSELPNESEDPIISDINFADQPILMLSITSDLPATEFIKLSEDVEERLKSVNGVSKITISGISEREVQVIANQSALSKFNLSITDLVGAISRANSSLPVGDIEMQGIKYPLKFKGDIIDPEEIKNIPVLNIGGEVVYVRDLAFISDGVSQNTSFSRVSVNGQPSQQAVSLSIFKKRGGDITKIVNGVKKELAEMQDGGILEGTEVLTSIDLAEYLNEDLKNLSMSGLGTVFLVILILFFTIGWREAMIAGLAIPFSFLIAFVGLYATGNTINFISLFALILAVGILVDSAIVVTEAMHTKIKGGMNGQQSAVETIKEFYMSLTSGTMTTVAAFFPLFFLSGIIGKFVSGIPYTLIFVLFASLFVALGIVPLISVMILKKRGALDDNIMVKMRTKYTNMLQQWYQEKLEYILDNKSFQKKFLWSMGLALILSFSLPVSGLLKTTLFPTDDLDFIYIDAEMPQGTILAETDMSIRAIEEVLYSQPYIESFATTVGSSNAFSDSGSGSGEKLGNITVLLKDKRSKTSSELVEDLRIALVGIKTAEIKVAQPSDGPPSGAPISIKFFSEDLDDLERVVLKAESILKDISGTVDVTNSMKSNVVEFVLEIDRAKLSDNNLSATMIAQVLRTAVYGVDATTIKTGGEDIDVLVKLNLNPENVDPSLTSRTTIDSIRQMEIVTQNGIVLLGSLVDINLQKSNSSISHEDGERIATVSAQLKKGANALEINKEFQSKIDDGTLSLPQGVSLKTGGENEDIAQTFTEMLMALIAGMILVIVVLILQFDSFRQTSFIVVGVVFSLIGVLVGLTLTGNAFSFPSFIGVIALAGIVVNNAIILIDTMNVMRKNKPEVSIKNIVIESASIRLRPVLLTTITTVIGMVPLLFASATWNPLAYSIIFGLSFATVITLILVPILYLRYTK